VIVSNTGVVKLVDFGIAKVQHASDPRVTGHGVIKGKMNYIAPEYLGGRLDARADLFAVGVIAHELLTGRRVFEGADDFETTARVLQMPIQPPSRWALNVPKDVDNIVLTALQRDPDQRWQSASALRNALAMTAVTENAIADHAKIIHWVAWAFSQRTRPSDRQLHKVLSMLDQPSTSEHALSPEQQRILEEVSQVQVFEEPPRVMRPDAMKHTTGYAGIPAIPNVPPPNLLESSRNKPLHRPDLVDSQRNPPLQRPDLVDSQRNAALQRGIADTQPADASLFQSGGSRPMIVEARPLQQKRGRKYGSLTPAGGEPVEDPSAPEPSGRFWLYAFLVLLAGAGGVLAMSYLLGLELF
jgi:serine/threonine protein kinase